MANDLRLNDEQRIAVEEFRKRHRTGVLALLFTDIVGSTRIKKQLGDAAGTELIQRQHALVREVLSAFSEAEEISTAGDSFFIVFAKPSDAVRFALRLQHQIFAQSEDSDAPVEIRIGIHMGEVFIQEKTEGALARDVLGVQVDTASRVMSLAAGGQVLLTRSVFDNARTILTGESLPGIEGLSWVNHGPYLLKGLSDPIDLCEVGECGRAKLRPPTDTDAGKQATVAGAEPVLGWRPAIEQVVPGTEWELVQPLGEGGFGEVWLARHRRTKEKRVFKFCFRADQLRNLKREMTLFRLLKEVLGERQDIARLYEVQFDKTPYYLELEYTPGGDLADWSESRGGMDKIPLGERLEIVAQIATALAAAHSVGVIHEDVKPSNVLVEERKDGSVQVRLTDFGIGQVTDRSVIERAGLTATGLTEMISPSAELSSRTGTRLYMAPELVAGRPPSTKSDLYSLGVLTYQVIVGDLTQPVATDWEKLVGDPLLCEDLHGCLAGDPGNRFAGAEELAERLRTLEERHAELARKKAADLAYARRRRVAVALSIASVFLLAVAVALGYGLYRAWIADRAQQRQLYRATLGFLDEAIESADLAAARNLLFSSDCPEWLRHWEWGWNLARCNRELFTLQHNGVVLWSDYSPDGTMLATAATKSEFFDGAPDPYTRIWNPATGELIRSIRTHDGGVFTVDFSPDGKYLATAGFGAPPKIWHARTGQLYLEFSEHSNALCALFLENGQTLWTADMQRNSMYWDVQSGQLNEVLHSARVLRLPAMNANQGWMVIASDRQTVEVFDIKTKQPLHSFRGLDKLELRKHCDSSPDGRFVAAGNEIGKVMVWSVETGRPVFSKRLHSVRVNDLCFSPDSRFLATAGDDRIVRVVDLQTSEEVAELRGHEDGVYHVDFSPDGRQLCTGGYDHTVRLWNLRLAENPLVIKGLSEEPKDLAVSPDGNQVAVAEQSSTLRVFDVNSGRLTGSLSGHLGAIRAVAFSPDGRWLASGDSNARITVWNVRDMAAHAALSGQMGAVHSVAFSPDSRRLASAGADKSLFLWDLAEPEKPFQLAGHEAAVRSVVFHPTQPVLASGGDDETVRIWDLETGQQTRTITAGATVHCVAFAPDGGRLAIAAYEETRIIDWKDGSTLHSFPGHVGHVHSVAFSPDGRRLATGAWGGTIKLWDAVNGGQTLELKRHTAESKAVFSPDGRHLITTGRNPEVAVWFSLPWKSDAYVGNSLASRMAAVETTKRRIQQERLAALRMSDPVESVERTFGSRSFSPGEPIQVALSIEWENDAPWIEVSEQIPQGWTAGNVSDDGQANDAQIVWNLEQWTSPGMTIRYTLTPPPESKSEPVYFRNSGIRSPHGFFPIRDDGLYPKAIIAFQEGILPDVDYDGCQDTHVLIYNPDGNAGGCEWIEEGNWWGGVDDRKKILVRFDLPPELTTFPLERAKLRLFNYGERKEGARNAHTLYVSRVLKPWGEGKGEHFDGAVSNLGDVTYNSSQAAIQKWEVPGVLGRTDVTDPESSTTVGADWPEWISFDVTDSVRHFLSHPDENFGWKISQDPASGIKDNVTFYSVGAYRFKSTESDEAPLRPMLVLISSERATATIAGGQ